ncbi:hypothetical protein AADZ86_03350 [Colwelliaceae bacterium BS250]
MSEQEKLFQLWLDGNLTAEQSQIFAQQVQDDEHLEQRLATARFVEQQVHCYEPKKVPAWDRASSFASDKKPWWQWQGLPALSLACSVCAIALVMFKVEVAVQDSGLLVNFGGSATTAVASIDNQAIDNLINQRLQEFAKEQETVLANYAGNLKTEQQDNNLQLVSYVLGTTRQERQQDMSSFVKYVNDQRDDDAIDQKLRYQQLKYAMQNQVLESNWDKSKAAKQTLQKTNYIEPNSQEK